MGKNKLKKWYANAHDCMTLRVVKTSTEEEVRVFTQTRETSLKHKEGS